MRPVVVHGGGSRISAAMEEAGLEPKFVQGRRFTDEKTLEIVEKVLAVETNDYLAREFETIGGRAMTLNFESTPVLYGEPLVAHDDNGEKLELGSVGHVTRVERLVIDNLCYAGQVPFIPSMCLTDDGQKLNVNADTAATAVATQLNAEKLVLLSDVPGVLEDADDPESLISTLTAEQANQLIETGKVQGGMLPKIQACLETIKSGVKKVHLIDGRIRHSLLLETYTTSGIGTVFVGDPKCAT